MRYVVKYTVKDVDKGDFMVKAWEWLKRMKIRLDGLDFKAAERARKRHIRRMRQIQNSYWD